MLSEESASGFTLVELLVTMSILAVLLTLGLPEMATYLQNSKLGAATSSLFTALQTARTEAIRGNAQAQLVLTDTPVDTADIANALTPAVGGRNWVVRATVAAGGFRAVEARAGAESEGGATVPALVIAGAASAPAVFDGSVSFNALGAAVDSTGRPTPYSIDISNPNAGVCAALGGSIRCRRINVSPGGQITACDPAAPVGDNRAC